MRGKKTEAWTQLDSVLNLSGYSEDQLVLEVHNRETKSLEYALKNGRPRRNFVCTEGGCRNKDPAFPVYRFLVLYTGKDNNIPYGIRRILWGMCRKCIRHMLKVWEEAKRHGEEKR